MLLTTALIATALLNAPSDAVPYEQLVLADEPIGYWRFEESSGDVALDSSGNGFHGIYNGAVGLNAPGAIGRSAEFNGVDAFVDLNSGSPWGGADELTIEAWVRIETAVPGLAAVVSPEATGFAHFQIGDAGWSAVYHPTWYSLVEVLPQLDDGEWHHYALTYDATAIRLYLDGEEASVGNSEGSAVVVASNVMIGRGFRNERMLDGWIDEAAIYYRSLGPDVIAERYLAGMNACIADLTSEGSANGVPDGLVTLSDFSVYLINWSGGQPSADITVSGECDPLSGGGDGVNLSDFSCFLSEWSLGCP